MNKKIQGEIAGVGFRTLAMTALSLIRIVTPKIIKGIIQKVVSIFLHCLNNFSRMKLTLNNLISLIDFFFFFHEESDADVEDNIESEALSRPEIGESGYSSEKPSAMASPVSPGGSTPANNQQKNDIVPNDLLLEGNNLPSPTDNSTDSINIKNSSYINMQYTPSPTDVSMTDLTQLVFPAESSSSEKMNTAMTESPISPDNVDTSNVRNLLFPSLSLTNSVTVNSDLTSPEGPTISPLSTSITSKESPTSPASSAFQSPTGENIERPISRLGLIEERRERKEDSPRYDDC